MEILLHAAKLEKVSPWLIIFDAYHSKGIEVTAGEIKQAYVEMIKTHKLEKMVEKYCEEIISRYKG